MTGRKKPYPFNPSLSISAIGQLFFIRIFIAQKLLALTSCATSGGHKNYLCKQKKGTNQLEVGAGRGGFFLPSSKVRFPVLVLVLRRISTNIERDRWHS